MESDNTQKINTTKPYFIWSFVGFLIWTTYYFYSFKTPGSPIKDPDKPDSNNMNTIIYFLVLVTLQICIGWTVIAATPGCNIVKDNGKMLGIIFISIIFPWLFIFGFSVLAVTLKPNFKSAFANIYGYFIVSSRANDILTDLLDNDPKNVSTNNNTHTIVNPTYNDALLKIYGNKGILINQITPENFNEYMTMLKPLMKLKGLIGDKYYIRKDDSQGIPGSPFMNDNETLNITDKYDANGNISEPANIIAKLYSIVVQRDNIGECSWYVYTALFVISIATYNIAKITCK